MTKKEEQQRWQAQDDAYTMARYQEIQADKARAARAARFAKEQATNLQKQAEAMSKVASNGKRTTKTSTTKPSKKK